MICSNCGHRTDDDSFFCKYCGKQNPTSLDPIDTLEDVQDKLRGVLNQSYEVYGVYKARDFSGILEASIDDLDLVRSGFIAIEDKLDLHPGAGLNAKG